MVLLSVKPLFGLIKHTHSLACKTYDTIKLQREIRLGIYRLWVIVLFEANFRLQIGHK